MATKRAHPDDGDVQESKRAHVAQETQLLPYNNNGFIMQVENGGMLRRFIPLNALQTQQDMSWQCMVLNNFQALDFSAINFYHSDLQYLKNIFTDLQGRSNYYEWRQKEKPEEVAIVEPIAGKCTYTMGLRVKGRPNGFAISEFGSVHRSKSTYGQFLSTTYSAIHEHNTVFGKIMDNAYRGEHPFKLESSVCVHLPEKEHEREARARQFLWVRRDNNPQLYATGQLDGPLEVVPMTLSEFDRLFEVGKTDGPSQEVPVLICGYIEGVKYGKEIQMMDGNGRKFSEKPYSLALKPLLYFIIEP
nr:ssDNA binding protein [Hyphantria cunea nucleopolyhedrovirus]UIX56383.1 ssDNA binding protein [Hyphantria cunea nucleopolyhedrovirus]